MYMRFGNILNELLMEYNWANRNYDGPFQNDDLILSVADDSPEFFVFVLQSVKLNRIIGKFEITCNKVGSEDSTTYVAKIKHSFFKVPDKTTMLGALGKLAEVIAEYMTFMRTAEHVEAVPHVISFDANSPVEKREFSDQRFEHRLRELTKFSKDETTKSVFSNKYLSRNDAGGWTFNTW